MANTDLLTGGIMGAAAEEPKRRGMSDEHKQKMQAGRDAAKARREQAGDQGRSRGRPATRHTEAPLPRPQAAAQGRWEDDPDAFIDALGSGEHLTRERTGSVNAFDIPMQGRREGWDYQWWATHIAGQEIDPSSTVEISRGSWFPVPATHFPQMCPVGWSRKTIDREGQRMYMRPMRLTIEARKEQEMQAYEQKVNRLAQQQAGDMGPGMARRVMPDGSPAAKIDVNIQPLL